MDFNTVIWPEGIQETALDLTKRKSVIQCCHPKPNCDKECLPEKEVDADKKDEALVKKEWNAMLLGSTSDLSLINRWAENSISAQDYIAEYAKNLSIFPNYPHYGPYAISIKQETNNHLDNNDSSHYGINTTTTISEYSFPNANLNNRIPLPIKQRLRRLLLDGVKPKHAWRLLRLDGFPPESIPPLKRVQNFMKNSRKKLLTSDVNDWLEITAKSNPHQSNVSLNVQTNNSQNKNINEIEYFSPTPPRLNQTIKQRLCKMWLDGYKPKEAEFMLQNSDVPKDSIPTIGQIRNFMKYCNRRGPPASSYPPYQMDSDDNYKNDKSDSNLQTEIKSHVEQPKQDASKLCSSEISESLSTSNETFSQNINIKEEVLSEDEIDETTKEISKNILTESIQEPNLSVGNEQNIWPMFRQQMPLIIKRRLRQYLYDGVKPKQALRYLIHEGFPTDKLPSLKQIQNFMKNCKKRGLQFIPPPWMDYQHYTHIGDVHSLPSPSLPEQTAFTTDIPSTSGTDVEENIMWHPTCNGRLTFAIKQKLFQLWMDGVKPKLAKRILMSDGLTSDNMPTLKQIQNFMKYCRKRKVQLKETDTPTQEENNSNQLLPVKQEHGVYSDTTEDEDEELEKKVGDSCENLLAESKNDGESNISDNSDESDLSDESNEAGENVVANKLTSREGSDNNKRSLSYDKKDFNFDRIKLNNLENATKNNNFQLNYTNNIKWDSLDPHMSLAHKFETMPFYKPRVFDSSDNALSDGDDYHNSDSEDSSSEEADKGGYSFNNSNHSLINMPLTIEIPEQEHKFINEQQPRRISYIVKVMLYKLLEMGLKPKQVQKVLLMEGLPPDKIPILKQIQNFKKYCRRRGFCINDEALMKAQIISETQNNQTNMSSIDSIPMKQYGSDDDEDNKSVDFNDKVPEDLKNSIRDQATNLGFNNQEHKLTCQSSLKSRFSPSVRKHLWSLFIEGIKPKEVQQRLIQDGFPLFSIPTLKQVQNFVKNSRKRQFPFSDEDWIPEVLPKFLKSNDRKLSPSEVEDTSGKQAFDKLEKRESDQNSLDRNNFAKKENVVNNFVANKAPSSYSLMQNNSPNNEVNTEHLETILNETNVTKKMTFGIKQKLYRYLIDGVKPKFAIKLLMSEGITSDRMPSLKQIQNFMKNCRKKGLPSEEMCGDDSRASSLDAGPSNAISDGSANSFEDSDNSSDSSGASNNPDSDDDDVKSQEQINRVQNISSSILFNNDKKRMLLSIKKQLWKFGLSNINPKTVQDILVGQGTPTNQIPSLKQINDFMKDCQRRKLFNQDFRNSGRDSVIFNECEDDDDEEKEELHSEGNISLSHQVSDSSNDPNEIKPVWKTMPSRKRMPLLVKQRLCELLLEGVKPRLAREILIDNGLPMDKLPSLKQIQNFMKNCRKRGMPFVEEELTSRQELLSPVCEPEAVECLDLVTHNRNKDSKSLNNVISQNISEIKSNGTIIKDNE